MSKEEIEKLKQSLKIARVRRDKPGQGSYLKRLGDVYFDLIDFKRFKRKIKFEEGQVHISYVFHDPEDFARRAIDRYDKALKIFMEIGDKEGKLNCLTRLVEIYSAFGEERYAIRCCKEALKILREKGDKLSEVRCLGSLANFYLYLGYWKSVIKYGEEALNTFKEIGDKESELNCLTSLGFAYSRLSEEGHWNKAVNYYEEARRVFREEGDRLGEAMSFGNLGGIYSDLGDLRKAMQYGEAALIIFKEIGDKGNEGMALRNIGSIYSSLGDWKNTIDYYEEALRVFRELGDRQTEVRILNSLGSICRQLGKPQKAIRFFERALAILNEITSFFERERQTAMVNSNIASVMIDQGKYDEAERLLWKSLGGEPFWNSSVTIESTYFQANTAATFHNLASLMLKKGRFDDARKYVLKSLCINERMGDRREEAESLVLLAQIDQAVGKLDEAVSVLGRAARTQTEIRDEIGLMYNYQTLSSVLSAIGETDRALEFLRVAMSISDKLKLPQSVEIATNIQKLERVVGKSRNE